MVRRRKRRGGLEPEKYLSPAQAKKLLKHVKERVQLAELRGRRVRAWVDRMLVELLLCSGLRAGEAVNLDIRDLPIAHKKDVLHVRNGKGSVERVVEIPKRLTARIRQFCARFRKGAESGDTFLANERGGRLSYDSIYSKVRRIGQRAGIGELHPHMLRHTYAVKLYGAAHDLALVQDQLGHADPATTRIYAQTSAPDRRVQIEHAWG